TFKLYLPYRYEETASRRRINAAELAAAETTTEQEPDESVPSEVAFSRGPASAIELSRDDAALAGKKILIVDDDIRNVFALASVLETRGMQVLYAENGRDGIDTLRTPM